MASAKPSSLRRNNLAAFTSSLHNLLHIWGGWIVSAINFTFGSGAETKSITINDGEDINAAGDGATEASKAVILCFDPPCGCLRGTAQTLFAIKRPFVPAESQVPSPVPGLEVKPVLLGDSLRSLEAFMGGPNIVFDHVLEVQNDSGDLQHLAFAGAVATALQDSLAKGEVVGVKSSCLASADSIVRHVLRPRERIRGCDHSSAWWS